MRSVRLAAPAVASLAILLAITGVLRVPAVPGLPATPFLTLLLVPVLRVAMFLSGIVSVGGALLGGVIGDDARVLRLAVRSSVVYAIVSAAMSIVTLADVLATQWWQALNPTMLISFITQIDEGRYLMLQVVLGCSAALILQRVQHRIDATFAFLALLTSVCLPGFTGHSAAAVTHWLASTTMVFHLAAMNLWLGGVFVLLATQQLRTLASFSNVALASYIVLIASGVANLLARIGDWTAFWSDPYALVLAGKVLLVLVLGVLGWGQRRRVIAAASDANFAKAVQRVLAIEASLMLTAVVFAVVLARMANP